MIMRFIEKMKENKCTRKFLNVSCHSNKSNTPLHQENTPSNQYMAHTLNTCSDVYIYCHNEYNYFIVHAVNQGRAINVTLVTDK